MPFPNPEATNISAETSLVGTHTVSLPADIAAGELLIVNFGYSTDPGTITELAIFAI